MGVPRSRDSVLWCLRWVPYEDDKGRTHWEGCWRERGHHNCAVAMVERLTQAQEPVGYVVVYDNGKGDRDIHHGELWDYAEDAQMAADAMNGARNGFTYTVEPVGASPVASAPNTYNARDELDALAGAPDGALEGVIDVAGRMKAYGYDAETLRVLTEHIFGGAEIPMPASAPEPYDASKEPIALNFLDNIFDCWKMGGDAFDRFMRAQRRQIEDVLASAPVWPEPGAPAPATKPPLGKIRPSAPEEEREAFDPLTCLPGEYEIGRAIREVANHDPERMRFYLTCSIGELAQRIARLRATQREGGEG